MKKNDKKLKKALSLFESGNYEEALSICGKILEKDYNNEEALTLESRILYYYGDLNEAKLTWKINSDYNDNIESKEFLNNVNEYTELKNLYENALKDIENGSIDDAINKLNQCSSSSFNKLNIKKALESCSDIKKGITPTSIKSSYEEQKADSLIHSLVDEKITKEIRAAIQEELAKKQKLNEPSKENTNKVINKNNNVKKYTEVSPNKKEKKIKVTTPISKETSDTTNKNSMKESENLNTNSNHRVPEVAVNNKSHGKALKISAVVIAGVLVAGIAYSTIKNTNFSSSSQSNEVSENTNNNSINNDSISNVSQEFNSKKFEMAIKDKNVNELYALLTSTSKDSLKDEDLKLYNKAEEIMKAEGVEKFYNDGLVEFKEKKYADSLPYFEKALKFSDNSYLQRHILYFMASANDNLNNKAEATKYYEMYINKFLKSDSQGDDPFYSPEVLYKLANYYKDSDKALSKKYASLIESDFPNSIFYNDVTLKLIYN